MVSRDLLKQSNEVKSTKSQEDDSND